MKAIVFNAHGGPEVLKFSDASEPAIRQNEVLVRVKACALNHLDLWVRKGIPGVRIPLPHTPGSDISAGIAQVGADVTSACTAPKGVLATLLSGNTCQASVAGMDNRYRQPAS